MVGYIASGTKLNRLAMPEAPGARVGGCGIGTVNVGEFVKVRLLGALLNKESTFGSCHPPPPEYFSHNLSSPLSLSFAHFLPSHFAVSLVY